MVAISSNRSISVQPSLSGDLRAWTALLHDQAETLLGLPGNISGRREYIDWLAHFLAFYDPLERAFDTFPEWNVIEPFSAKSTHSQRLTRDLRELGFDGRALAHLPNARIPTFHSFAHALGARYVLEGSTLGGKVILRDLQVRIGAEIAGATDFFSGGAPAVSSDWRVFKMALDRFGERHPECREDVLTGAEQTFRALLDWFEPFVMQRRCQQAPAHCGEGVTLERADHPTRLDSVGDPD